MDLRLHVLEAGGSLDRWRTRMDIEAKAVSARIDVLVDARDRQVPVDVVVRRDRAAIVPELGLGGSCYEPHLVTIAIAPDSETFERSFDDGAFGMTLAHELHHAMRHVACGYGATLGEAIVSEGLADHFAREVTGCAPPLWARNAGLSPAVFDLAKSRLSDIDYDHHAWFFGRGELPRWAGYAIGWRLIADYLDKHAEESAASLVGTDSAGILSAAWPN